MVKVIWTERSLRDMEVIGDYISEDSIKFAGATLEKLYKFSTDTRKKSFIGHDRT